MNPNGFCATTFFKRNIQLYSTTSRWGYGHYKYAVTITLTKKHRQNIETTMIIFS